MPSQLESKITIKDIRKSIWKVRHGYWYVPYYPTKYRKERELCDEETCGNCSEVGYHYIKVPTRFRRGKKQFSRPANPTLILTSEDTLKTLKEMKL